jgi:hypothetical protein
MKEKLRKIKIKLTRIPPILSLINLITLWTWTWKTYPNKNPPAIVKQHKVISLAKKYEIHHLIETGTYLGDMVYATKDIFDGIDSIELSPDLYTNAVKRFRHDKHIQIWNGDSSLLLDKIIQPIDEPIIFWLDAHYSGGITARADSGDTPIEKELDTILRKWNEKSIILIDDARCFTGNDGYPTIDTMKNTIDRKSQNLNLEIENDIITIKNKNYE